MKFDNLGTIKNSLIILITFCSFNGWSQCVDFFAGWNDNHFFDFNDVGRHYNSSYTSGEGYSFGVAIDEVELDWMIMRIAIRYNRYGGKIRVREGGLGGSFNTIASMDKSILAVGVFPINFEAINRFHFNLGMEFSRLMTETYEGIHWGSIMGQSSWNEDLEEEYDDFSSVYIAGLTGRVSYEIQLNELWSLIPQYVFYFGLTNEFRILVEETKSLRNFVGVGVKRTLVLTDVD